MQELWDIFPENRSDLERLFKRDTDIIKARIKFKAENNSNQ